VHVTERHEYNLVNKSSYVHNSV